MWMGNFSVSARCSKCRDTRNSSSSEYATPMIGPGRGIEDQDPAHAMMLQAEQVHGQDAEGHGHQRRGCTTAGGGRSTAATRLAARRTRAPPQRTASAHRLSAPPQRTASAHRLSAPPQRTASAHRLSAPPQRTASAHRLSAPPQRTASAHRLSAPPQRTASAHRLSAPPQHTAGPAAHPLGRGTVSTLMLVSAPAGFGTTTLLTCTGYEYVNKVQMQPWEVRAPSGPATPIDDEDGETAWRGTRTLPGRCMT